MYKLWTSLFGALNSSNDQKNLKSENVLQGQDKQPTAVCSKPMENNQSTSSKPREERRLNKSNNKNNTRKTTNNIRSRPGQYGLLTWTSKTTLRGSPPVKVAFFVPHRIPENHVPSSIVKIYESANTMRLLKMYPEMKVKDWTILNAQNYLTRFQLSLWLEEIKNDKLRRQYDMTNVILQRDEDLFVFQVPQLDEIYPAVVEGDAVRCTLSDDSENIYEGFIHKICYSDLTNIPQLCVNFHERLRINYDKSPVLIQFALNRSSYKTQLFAVSHSINHLGLDWLFPVSEKLDLKPERIKFDDDPNDNIYKNKDSQVKKPEQSMQLKLESRYFDSINDGRAKSFRYAFVSNIVLPSVGTAKLRWHNQNLNQEQKHAVKQILTGSYRPLPYIIWGLSGTGKTVTMIEAILQIYFIEKSSRILVTVPSQSGTHLIAELLLSTKLFSPGQLVLFNEMPQCDSTVNFCMDATYMQVVANHRLIICTTKTAGLFYQMNKDTNHFSHCFIDDSASCTEPETLVPILLTAVSKEGQIILAGDPKSLNPILLCDFQVNDILTMSLMERLLNTEIYSENEIHNHALVTKLFRNYRAHPKLVELSSQMFYDNELISTANNEVTQLCQNLDFLPRKGIPYLFHGVEGICIEDPGSRNGYNLEEVAVTVKYIKLLTQSQVSMNDIGVITCTRKQAEKIRMTLTHQFDDDDAPKIGTIIEDFQGIEKKIIIISTVRSNYDDVTVHGRKISRLDFFYSKKTFNLIITRAKSLIIFIGNPHILQFNSCWDILLRYCKVLRVYIGVEIPRHLDAIKEDVEKE